MVHEQYHPKLLAIAPMRITIRHGFSPWQSQNERPMVGQNQDSKLTLLPQVPSWVASSGRVAERFIPQNQIPSSHPVPQRA